MPSLRDAGVVLVAAGRGRRFGSERPKQFQVLGPAPVLLHALRPFASHPAIAHVVIVLAPDDAVTPPEWITSFGTSRVTIVAGGAERHESVRAGLSALPAECTIVLIHDGARPFPAAAMIDDGIAAARRGHSAIPALPICDTIKRADEFGRVLSTVDRHGLWTVQTPQAFPRAVLERAHAAAGGDAILATDDAALVERIGEPIDLIPGSPRNLKITTPHDLVLAEWYLEHC